MQGWARARSVDPGAHTPKCHPHHRSCRLSQPRSLAPTGAHSGREQTQSRRLINHSYSRPWCPLSCPSSLCAPNISSLRSALEGDLDL